MRNYNAERINTMSDDNIIPFQPRSKIEESQKYRPPPMLNIPPATKILTGLIIFIHLGIFGLTNSFMPNAEYIASYFGGFTAASWSGIGDFYSWTPFTIFTFSFLHGGWLHLGFNTVMLVAMGSGLEKSMGIKKYLIIYFGSTLFAVLAHLAIYPASTMPIIGASGGISGVFGAMLILLNKQSSMDTGIRTKLLPIIAIYIGITILIGLMGGPDGSSVAWVAHIGGFLAGIGIMLGFLKSQK